MDKSIVYTKTAKGTMELKNKGKNLDREQARVLSLINGKSSIADFISRGALLEDRCAGVLLGLSKLGLIRAFEVIAEDLPNIEWSTQTLHEDDEGELSDGLPTLEVKELSPQESVEAWAQARRGANELKTRGFYTYGSKYLVEIDKSHHVGLSALVVDDDDELAELLLVLLSEKGLAVQVARDLPEALTVIQSGERPDLVLLDIVLPGHPGKDGFDVLAHIRSQKSWADVPVIMVTSEVSDDQVMKGLKIGADAYIFKPFKWEALYACIKTLVGI